MKSFITGHQLNQILSYIKNHYQSYGTVKSDGDITFADLNKPADLVIPTPKTTIPFKKILWPNFNCHPVFDCEGRALRLRLERELVSGSLNEKKHEKIALIGLTNCDAIALKRFLKEFEQNDLVTKRKDILVVVTECQSDEFCFCTAFKDHKIENFDLYLQKEKSGYSIFSNSKIGESILKENGIKNMLAPKIREIILKTDKFDEKELTLAVNDRDSFADFWQKISNNCFGCGSCSVVCPLCFCVKYDFTNEADGSSKKCLKWDSCFAKDFSEIQDHFDFRPQNVDRLYNWYHHKFVRAKAQHDHFLCTGCGRCIQACPAHLNQHRILKTLENKEENE